MNIGLWKDETCPTVFALDPTHITVTDLLSMYLLIIPEFLTFFSFSILLCSSAKWSSFSLGIRGLHPWEVQIVIIADTLYYFISYELTTVLQGKHYLSQFSLDKETEDHRG
jgi:hypothetical protein